jgi:hypothetical protein
VPFFPGKTGVLTHPRPNLARSCLGLGWVVACWWLGPSLAVLARPLGSARTLGPPSFARTRLVRPSLGPKSSPSGGWWRARTLKLAPLWSLATSPLASAREHAFLAHSPRARTLKLASHAPRFRSLAVWGRGLGPGSSEGVGGGVRSDPRSFHSRARRPSLVRSFFPLALFARVAFRRSGPQTLARSLVLCSDQSRSFALLGPSPVRPRFAWTNLTSPKERAPSKLTRSSYGALVCHPLAARSSFARTK